MGSTGNVIRATAVGLLLVPAQAGVNNDFVIGEWSCDNPSLNGVSYEDAGILGANNQMRVIVRRDGTLQITERLTNTIPSDTFSSGRQRGPDLDIYINGRWGFDGTVLYVNPASTQLCEGNRCWNMRPLSQQYRLIDENVLAAEGLASLCTKVSGPRPHVNPPPRNPSVIYPSPSPNQNTFRQRHSLRSRMEIMNDINSVEADIARCERNSDFNAQHNMGTWYNTMCASQVASDRARLGALRAELSAADH